MVTISGEFMRTRLIPILCPHLLWKRKITPSGYTPKLVRKEINQQIKKRYVNYGAWANLLDSCEGPLLYLLLVTVPQMTRVSVEASVDWKKKKRRVDAFSTAKNKRRQIKIKMTGACRERRKRTVGEASVRGPFFVLKVKNGDGWQQGGKTKKLLYCLSLTRVRWWRHNAPALWTAAGRRMPHSYGTRTADTHGEGRVGR